MDDIQMLKEAKAEAQARLEAMQREQEAAAAAAEEAYRERLAGIVEAANADLARADEIESAVHDDSTGWLAADELAEAQARQPFVLEDLQKLDGDGLVARMNRVAEFGDPAARWLHLRLVPQLWDALDAEVIPISLRAEYNRALESLQAAVVPEEVLSARENAHTLRLAAEKRRVDALFELWNAGGRQGSFNPYK